MQRKTGPVITPLPDVRSPPAQSSPPILLRLPQVQAMIPVSRSTWYAGIKTGLYPGPLKISARASAWRLSDIEALVERFKP